MAIHRRLLARSTGLSGQLAGHEMQIDGNFVAVEIDSAGLVRETVAEVELVADVYVVTIDGQARRISLASPMRDIATSGRVDGEPFQAQVERVGLGLRLSHGGVRLELRILAPRAAVLRALMPWKPPPDMSRYLLSPMPGLLVAVVATAGQAVRAGERLAVIEAMKMENIVVAAHDGVVARVVAVPGQSVAVDEVILEFEARAAAPAVSS